MAGFEALGDSEDQPMSVEDNAEALKESREKLDESRAKLRKLVDIQEEIHRLQGPYHP